MVVVVSFLPVVIYIIVLGVPTSCCRWWLAPCTGETLSICFRAHCPLSPILSVVPTLQVLFEMVLDTLSPVPIACLPFSVVLYPILLTFPHLGAGAGGGASPFYRSPIGVVLSKSYWRSSIKVLLA